MKRSLLWCTAAMLSAGTFATAQPPAPGAPAPAKDAHAAPKAKPPIYDEKADAGAVIDAAIAKAARNNRRVLVQWGANWCPWCHLLHEAMGTDAALKHELSYEYDVVLVDVGRFDKNMDLAARYGAELKKTGIPYLTVLDGAGKVIVNQESGALESKEPGKQEHDRAAVLKFLKANEAAPRAADDVLKDGLSRARTDGKLVFLHFGAPWCPWCHVLENWMDRPEVAPVLAKAFVDVKVDVDRDTGGKDVLARFNAKGDQGIPWFVFLDDSGKTLASSTGPKGNIGYPSAPEEIDHFISMIRSAHAHLADGDVDTIADSLKKNAPKNH